MSTAFLQQQKRRSRSRSLPIRRGIASPATFPQQQAQADLRYWARSPMLKRSLCAALFACSLALTSCNRAPEPNTVVMIIESSPTNLDPRVGTDAQSERIGKLIFDSLVKRDEHFNLQPWVAESWDIPNPTTYIFHLKHGVSFHNGQPLTSRDVKWTFDSMLDGSIVTAKTSTYKLVDRIDAPDDFTVIFHLKE